MKKILYSFGFLTLVLMSFQNCKKESEQIDTPDPYTYSGDLSTAKNITSVSFVVSDLEMLCGFLGDFDLFPDFYLPISDSTGIVNVSQDTSAKKITIKYNKTKCVDGKTRSGSVLLDYSGSAYGSLIYRNPGFTTKVTLSNYEVDDWKIALSDQTKPIIITNQLTNSQFNPQTENLCWLITGSLKITNKQDSSKNTMWNGGFKKELTNTNNPDVFNPNKQKPIVWKKAIVSYKYDITGTTSYLEIPFTFKSNSPNPIVRDFNCSWLIPTMPEAKEIHPFTSGEAQFQTSSNHPRTINYGPDEPAPCDFSGRISFKDESHTVAFEF